MSQTTTTLVVHITHDDSLFPDEGALGRYVHDCITQRAHSLPVTERGVTAINVVQASTGDGRVVCRNTLLDVAS